MVVNIDFGSIFFRNLGLMNLMFYKELCMGLMSLRSRFRMSLTNLMICMDL